MPCQGRFQRDGLQFASLHDDTSVDHQGTDARRRTKQERRNRITGPAIAHVPQIEQRQVGALAGLQASDVIAAEQRAPSRVAIISASRTPSAAAP